MKALVLAAGLGERLRPLTNDIPKPMIKVGGKPVLEHIVNYLYEHDITEIIVNLHYLPERIMQYFGTKLMYSYEPELLGTAGTIKKILPWMSRDFVVLNGDTFAPLNLTGCIDTHKRFKHRATIVRDKYDKCVGTMIFNKDIEPYLQEKGMIDDCIKNMPAITIPYLGEWIDIGSHSELQRAREKYGA